MRSHPALDRPLIAAIVRLARKYRPQDLAKLGTLLDECGFRGRPGFFHSQFGTIPNIAEESALRWLALSRQGRDRYAQQDVRFHTAIWFADALTELLRKALHTG